MFNRSILLLFVIVSRLMTLHAQGLRLSNGGDDEHLIDHSQWKVMVADDPVFSSPSCNDSNWTRTSSHLNAPGETAWSGKVVWLRYHLKFDSARAGQAQAILMDQYGASEIYFDGFPVARYGKVSVNADSEVRFSPRGMPIAFNSNGAGYHVIAVRYSNHEREHSSARNDHYPGFEMQIVTAESIQWKNDSEKLIVGLGVALTTFYLALAIVHFLIWIYYRTKKGNLHYVLFMLSLSVFPIGLVIAALTNDTTLTNVVQHAFLFDVPLVFLALINLVYHFFYDTVQRRFRWYLFAAIAGSLMSFISPHTAVLLNFTIAFTFIIDAIITVIKAVRNRKQGSKIIATGILCFAGFFFIAFSLLSYAGFTGTSVNLGSAVIGSIFLVLFFISLVSIPVSMSLYLAKDFAMTNVSLSHKLKQVEILSRKTLEQEKEKQNILEGQKEMLEKQVQERTTEIIQQKEIIEEKNKSITDSILYALRIQEALLPTEKYIEKSLKRLREE